VHEQGGAHARFVEHPFRARHGDTVIGCIDEECVGRLRMLGNRRADVAHGAINRFHHAIQLPDFRPNAGNIRQPWRDGDGLWRIKIVTRAVERAMRLVEACHDEEGRVRLAGVAGVAGVVGNAAANLLRDNGRLDGRCITVLIAEPFRVVIRLMLEAEEVRRVAAVREVVRQAADIGSEFPAAMREAHHAVRMRIQAGHQAGTARRALRRGAVRPVELHARCRERVEVRRRHPRAVAAEMGARIVRHDEDDVRLRRSCHACSFTGGVSTNRIIHGMRGNPKTRRVPYFDRGA